MRSSSATASASPSASIIVVEVVGASPIGQASAAARQQQHHVGRLGQASNARLAGDRDQRDVEPARIGDDVGELGALARIRQGEHRVAGADHAEIAVARLGGMDEQRRRAGRGEGRGDLARDMAALADAGDDEPAARPRRTGRAPRRMRRRARRELLQPVDLGADHPARDGKVMRQARLLPAVARRRRKARERVVHNDRMPLRSLSAVGNTASPRRYCGGVASPLQAQCAKMSCSAQPSRSSRTRARQEVESGSRQLGAALARQHRVEPGAQRVQMQHVGGGILQLLVGQVRRAPIRALLLLR